mgnify:FL=1|tara:strand:- start:342 stop:824 length:483 start_codon:yes stop_codon:yes gene_type:complete
MEKQVLFTITQTLGRTVTKVVDIYGPTNELLEKTKPVSSVSKYAGYVLVERRDRLKKLDSYEMRNKYHRENKMDELEQMKNDVMKETNWKLRVLDEQSKQRIAMKEAAETLLMFAKTASRDSMRELRRQKRELRKQNIGLHEPVTRPTRRSQRLLEKQHS